MEVAGTELATNMTMIGSVAGITKCVSNERLGLGLAGTIWERNSWHRVVRQPWTKPLRKSFAKKEMLLKKNLDTVKRSYEIAAEWAEKNNVEVMVGEPAAA